MNAPAPSEKIRIMVVDDHLLFRESISRLLAAEPDFQVVGQCGSLQEAFEVIDDRPVDVVLLDLDLGGEQGSKFFGMARKRGFAGRVLIVAAGVSDREAASLIRDGAVGIFLKQSSPDSLAKCIRKVAVGELWLDQRYLHALLQDVSDRPESPSQRDKFTAREREVLRYVIEGKGNKEIAGKIGVSETTIKATLQQIFEKTGVRSRSQLVRVILEDFRDQL